jgi:hypothetical protein
MSLARSLTPLLFGAMTCTVLAQEHSVRPKQGFVPNAETAISIAVAVWTPIYGGQRIAAQRPYLATLADGKWTVTGTLPKGWRGGTAIAVVSQSDGRILQVSHGR